MYIYACLWHASSLCLTRLVCLWRDLLMRVMWMPWIVSGVELCLPFDYAPGIYIWCVCCECVAVCCSGCNTHTKYMSFYFECFNWECSISEIRHFENLRFLGISRYKFKLRCWFNLNLFRGIWVSGFGGLGGCSICSGICHTPRLCILCVLCGMAHVFVWSVSWMWMWDVIRSCVWYV